MSDELSPYDTELCPGCGQHVEFAWIDVSLPQGHTDRVKGRWLCRTVGCKYGEPAETITIHLDNSTATYGRAQGTTTDDNAGG